MQGVRGVLDFPWVEGQKSKFGRLQVRKFAGRKVEGRKFASQGADLTFWMRSVIIILGLTQLVQSD
jgi:hypothetical protein